jgi:2-oxo-hept-3-ene-1,7-dioate hydratase
VLSETQRQAVSAALSDAERGIAPVCPLSETLPAIDVEDAYAIRRMGVEQRMAGGARLAAHKIGLTSRATSSRALRSGLRQARW